MGPAVQDDRVSVISSALLSHGSNLNILDVGCNDGRLTIALANAKAMRQMVGIDIDGKLVSCARKNLSTVTTQFMKQRPHKEVPLSCRVVQRYPKDMNKVAEDVREHIRKETALPDASEEQKVEEEEKAVSKAYTEYNHAKSAYRFPFNITFRCEDFASSTPARTANEAETYDVIMCLSVTKWVHLTGGDNKLKRLFRRISDCLKPGGLLLLEPQPIKSYKRAIRNGLASKDHDKQRRLQPVNFTSYLVKHYDFDRVRTILPVKKGHKRFNRPIYALHKRLRPPLENLLLDTPATPADDAENNGEDNGEDNSEDNNGEDNIEDNNGEDNGEDNIENDNGQDNGQDNVENNNGENNVEDNAKKHPDNNLENNAENHVENNNGEDNVYIFPALTSQATLNTSTN